MQSNKHSSWSIFIHAALMLTVHVPHCASRSHDFRFLFDQHDSQLDHNSTKSNVDDFLLPGLHNSHSKTETIKSCLKQHNTRLFCIALVNELNRFSAG